MAVCLECRKTVGYFDIVAGRCGSCRVTNSPDSSAEDEALGEAVGQLTLTTEMTGASANAERLGIVSGTCVFGQHLGKDIMAAWRDVLGGRAKAIELVMSDARTKALEDMSQQAASLGATSVIAVHIQHQELNGGGKSMVMVTATGTAIRATDHPGHLSGFAPHIPIPDS